MRILSLACFGVTLLACSELPATALNSKNFTESDNLASSSSKSEFITQNHWSTQASLLVAQGEDSSEAENQQVADGSWSSDSEKETSDPSEILFDLQRIQTSNFEPSRGAPSFTLSNPTGFGADGGSAFIGLGFTPVSRLSRVAEESEGDAEGVIGIGLGNAQKTAGLELSYSLLSFGSNQSFGSGVFNAKLHRSIAPGWGVAIGYSGFIEVGDSGDIADSAYLTTTRIFSTREKLDSTFSRVAVTIGIGNGFFRTEDAIENDEDGFNPFGSLAFRVARPVSGVIEWTGQDLAVGTSVSPFRTLPITFNLGLRDIVGAGDGARVVFGVGAGF